MTSLNISLPQPLKDFVEDQVRKGGYSTPSEYIRALVREDQKRRADDRLESLILEGLNSGDPVEVTPQFWGDLREELTQRLKSRKN